MSRRGSFAPVVLVGLVAAALLAVASAKVWVSHSLTLNGRDTGLDLVGSDIGKLPLASALSYLLLAGWGVLLVTRGIVRRLLAVVVVLVSLGLVACVVLGGFHLGNDVQAVYLSQTQAGAKLSTGFTTWYWVAAAAAVVSLVATLAAVRFVGEWPAMGRRYDAPDARTTPEVPVARPDADPDDPEAGNLALWRSIDEGHDPTDPTDPTAPSEPTTSSEKG